MSNYRRAKLVYDSFRSRSRLLLACSKIVSKDVKGIKPDRRLSNLNSNKPNFQGFFPSSTIKPVGTRIIKTAQRSTSPFLGRANNRYNYSSRAAKYVMGFVGCVVVGIVMDNGKFETIPYTNRTHFVMLTPTWDKMYGDMMVKSAKENEEFKGKLLPDTHPQTIRVRHIGNRLVEATLRDISKIKSDQEDDKKKKGSRVVTASHMDNKEWVPEFLVVDDPEVFAYNLVTAIMLSTGLLHHFNRDEEIATALGHEIAHLVARHNAELHTNSMLVLTYVRFQRNGFNDYYFPKLTKYLFSLLQRMEFEADYIGMLLLASAGYDPRVVPTVYKKLYEVTGDDLNSEYIFFTHPSGKERIEKLVQAHVMEEALSKYQEVQAQYEDINKEEYVCNDYALQCIEGNNHVQLTKHKQRQVV